MSNAEFKADNSGFLIGRPAVELTKRLIENQETGLELLRKIAGDVNRMAGQARAQQRVVRGTSSAARPAAATPAPAAVPTRRAAPAARAPASLAPPAATATRVRDASGRFVSAAATATRARDGSGRFVAAGAGSGRGATAVPGGAPAAPGAPRPAPAPKPPKTPKSDDASAAAPGTFFASRRAAARDLLGQAADVDATTGAAREVAGVASPLIRLFRGDPDGRREKRQERKAEARQKRSEGWLKRIADGVRGRLGEASTKSGGGLLGFLASLLMPLIARFVGPQSLLGKLGGLGGGIGGLGRRVGGSALMRRLPVIGTLLTGLMYSAKALGDERNPTLNGEQRRTARYRNGGRAFGGLSGALIGGFIGSAGGPIGAIFGAWLGGKGGDKLGGKFGEWTKSLVDADLPSKMAAGWSEFIRWVKASPTIQTLMRMPGAVADSARRAGGAAVDFGGGLLDRIGHIESGGDYSNDAQRRRYQAGTGGSTASGKYQLLDTTFAGVVAQHGSGSPALSGLVPLAQAYLADKRSVRVKANDIRYAPLAAAKLNPASAEAAMGYLTRDNHAQLRAAGISSPTDAQTYSMHLSGNTAIARAMQNAPGTPIGQVLTAEQIAANAPLLAGITTVGDLGVKLNRKLSVAPGIASMPAVSQLSTLTRPPALPAVPDVAASTQLSGREPKAPVVVVPIQDIGQNVSDRGVAHLATGGVGLSFNR